MFMTSPPYFRKRDYGTSKWVGGRPDCDHRPDERWYKAREIGSSLTGSGKHQRQGAAAQWLRPQGRCRRCDAVAVNTQIGMEEAPDEYVSELVDVFAGAYRVLRDDGTLWIVIGDSYRLKQRLLIPARLALALQAAGWFLRDEIIWKKSNPTPSSARDRTTPAHETVYVFSKSPHYYYDMDAIKEPAKYAPGCGWAEEAKGTRGGKRGVVQRRPIDPEQSFRAIREMRHPRSVWTVPTTGFNGAHFATYPPALIRPMILAGCPRGGLVIDPFFGSGTTGVVANELGRDCIGIDINAEYCRMARRRLGKRR
jgi:site-specific DNA-methyltransferase (adenine-specific)